MGNLLIAVNADRMTDRQVSNLEKYVPGQVRSRQAKLLISQGGFTELKKKIDSQIQRGDDLLVLHGSQYTEGLRGGESHRKLLDKAKKLSESLRASHHVAHLEYVDEGAKTFFEKPTAGILEEVSGGNLPMQLSADFRVNNPSTKNILRFIGWFEEAIRAADKPKPKVAWVCD